MVEELRIAEVFDNRMSDRYILGDDGKTPVPCEDMIEWGNWMNVPGNRTVKQEHINGKFISTVFLALDHSFGSGEPLLFETMVFSGPSAGAGEEFCERSHTWEEAWETHKRAVEQVTAGIP